jgi:VCBS repeat-containing protein
LSWFQSIIGGLETFFLNSGEKHRVANVDKQEKFGKFRIREKKQYRYR